MAINAGHRDGLVSACVLAIAGVICGLWVAAECNQLEHAILWAALAALAGAALGKIMPGPAVRLLAWWDGVLRRARMRGDFLPEAALFCGPPLGLAEGAVIGAVHGGLAGLAIGSYHGVVFGILLMMVLAFAAPARRYIGLPGLALLAGLLQATLFFAIAAGVRKGLGDPSQPILPVAILGSSAACLVVAYIWRLRGPSNAWPR